MNETTTPILDTSVLDGLLRDREAARHNLKTIEGFIADERASLTFQKWGAKVGSIVRARGRLYRVTEIETRYWPTVWLRGNPQRKDGSFGTAAHNLPGDWELVG